MKAYAKQRSWTGSEMRKLKKLREGGLSFTKIGEAMGISAEKCKLAFARAFPGLVVRRKTTPVHIEEMARLRGLGLGPPEIAPAVGFSVDTVRRALAALGFPNVPRSSQRIRERQKAGLRRARREGHYVPGAGVAARNREKAKALGWPEAWTEGQARIMAALLERGAATVAAVAEAVGCSQKTMRNRLWVLKRHGLIEQFGVEEARTRPRILWRLTPRLAANHAAGDTTPMAEAPALSGLDTALALLRNR